MLSVTEIISALIELIGGLRKPKPPTPEEVAEWGRKFEALGKDPLPPPLIPPTKTSKVVFLRFDGIQHELDWLACSRCKNYFWVEHAEMEVPAFCCYCGLQFGCWEWISNDAAKDMTEGPE